MVRDEADIIVQWLDHHVAQGVDVMIITDNGSVDGTREVLEEFAASGRVEVDLRHDPEHRKQQSQTVTRMARDAATEHGADWVVNADADEFLIAKDRSLTLHDVFERLDPAIGAFVVPVVNMVGPMATHGAGIGRLVWRDERSPEALAAVGLIAQPSSNAVHVGTPDVTVVQGNHQVSVANGAPVPEELELEVLHFPWRSLDQYVQRVEATGRAYEANPDLTPSPNHHGMRDYRRLQLGLLPAYYSLRHVSDADAEHGGFRRDDALVEFFASIDRPLDDTAGVAMDPAEVRRLTDVGRALIERDRLLETLHAELDTATTALESSTASERRLGLRVAALETLASAREHEIRALRARKVVRLADRAGDTVRQIRARIRS
ncbi:hypothetical protein ASF23_10080 [Curtobacterium sp. Leaf261]|nr:hypothetical protein ASF23_10080 [Curtobacterium sp. Leaf261]